MSGSRKSSAARFRGRCALNRAVFDAADGRCFYCGGSDGAFTRDHKLPRCRGGNNARPNIALSCDLCNAKKGPLTVEEFRVYLMLNEGRPPLPFFGEAAASVERDWLIVCASSESQNRARDELRGFLARPRRGAWRRPDSPLLPMLSPYMGDSA